MEKFLLLALVAAACLVAMPSADEHDALVRRLEDLSLDEIEFLSEASDAQLLPKAANIVSRHHPELEVRDLLKDGIIVPAKVSIPKAHKIRTRHHPRLKESAAQSAKAAEPDPPVTLVPPNGKIMSDSALKMVPQDVNADVYYTLDGTDPTVESPKYDPLKPVAVTGRHNAKVSVKAIAVDSTTGIVSVVTEGEYLIEGSLGVQAHEEREKAELLAKKAQDEVAIASKLAAEAIEKEETAYKISHEAMKLVENVDNAEARGVEALQAKARTAKEDFFAALQTSKVLHERERALGAQCQVSDSKWFASVETMLAAKEDFDAHDQSTRTVEWVGWLQKDRAEGEYERGRDGRRMAEAMLKHTKEKLTDAQELEKKLDEEATAGEAAAQEAKRAAEEADEDNFFAAELKEAERREKEAAEQANAAVAAKEEQEAAVAAAEADAAVQGADEQVLAEKLAEAKQAVEVAQAAAKKAGEAAERALEHARATKEAADRARAAMAARGKAATSALVAVNAENHARNTMRELTQIAHTARTKSNDARAIAKVKKVKRNGESAIAQQAGDAEKQATDWLNVLQEERDADQAALDKQRQKVAELQAQYDNAVEVERSAIDAVPIAQKDSDRCHHFHEKAAAALEKVVLSRRKAWKAAYKAETGNKELRDAANKVADIAKEERDAAEAKNKQAAGMEADALAVVQAKEAKVDEAEDLIAQAKAANDPDAEATAERAAQAATSALGAAKSAYSAAQTSAEAIRGSTKQTLDLADKLNQAVLDLGNSDEAEKNAKAMATKSNEMMKQAKEATQNTHDLWKEALEEHKLRIEDRDRKIKDRKRLEKELADGKVDATRKGRYLTRKEEIVRKWQITLAEVQGYHKEQQDQLAAAEADFAEADTAAAALEGTTGGHDDKLNQVVKDLADSKESVLSMIKAAGLDMTAKLLHMRSKWQAFMLEDAKQYTAAAIVQSQQAEPDLVKTTKIEQAALRTRDKLRAEQDGLVGQAVSKRKAFHVVWITKTELQIEAKKENVALHEELTQAKEDSTARLSLLEGLEETRRNAALEALQLRVESVWKKRQAVHDPDPKRRLEVARFSQIIAGWDRDGTPVGPGALDDWYLDTSKLTESFDGKPGFLKEEVLNRCSAACGEYAEQQCTEGRRFRACTRGRVYRVRFERTATLRAKSDWFVCRCNSGVMQLASRDVMDVSRVKNQLLQATLLPENMMFDVRLHTEEMLPDNHVHCFRDFEKWLTKDTPFAEEKREAFKELDRLALSPPEEAKKSYVEVRKLWYETCLREQEPAPLGKELHIGSTDGSFDLFEMKSQPYSTLDILKQPPRKDEEEEGSPEEAPQL
jgi:hypothetical protein